MQAHKAAGSDDYSGEPDDKAGGEQVSRGIPGRADPQQFAAGK
jgi:hypothetical protein